MFSAGVLNLRASSNGRIPVSKTVDQGSNPCARAKSDYELISEFFKRFLYRIQE